jgi:peptide/nickel transport system permease protein
LSTLWVGALIVAVVAGLCFAAPLLPLPDPLALDYANLLSPPSLAHPFGTDEVGRDMLSRVIWGGRIDLVFTFVVTYLSVLIGGAMGSIAGYFGGRRATVIMRLVDVVIAFPFIVLVLAIVAVFGPGLAGVYVGVIIAGWAFYARLTYSEMLVLRERQFILAARTLGFTDRRVIFRHAIPNLVRSSLVFSLSDLVFNLRGLATFSFLGVGVQPPAPEWGQLIAGGRNYLLVAPWITTLPGLVLVFVSIGFSMFGEGLADRLSVGEAARA